MAMASRAGGRGSGGTGGEGGGGWLGGDGGHRGRSVAEATTRRRRDHRSDIMDGSKARERMLVRRGTGQWLEVEQEMRTAAAGRCTAGEHGQRAHGGHRRSRRGSCRTIIMASVLPHGSMKS